MKFVSLLVGFAALAAATEGAAVPRKDPYVGDLRTFNQPGCLAENQGVGTFTESMVGACQHYPLQFSSIYIHINDGWAFRAHNDPTCRDEGTLIKSTSKGSASPIVCNDHTTAWVAYQVNKLEPTGAPIGVDAPSGSE